MGRKDRHKRRNRIRRVRNRAIYKRLSMDDSGLIVHVEPLTAYEEIATRILAPRGRVPRAMGFRSDPANVAMADHPWGKDFGFESSRIDAELAWTDSLLYAEDQVNLTWIPQPAPDDVTDQHKRSVLANTQYICYLSDDKEWYIGRERWAGFYDETGTSRIGVQSEQWSGPHASEAVAQRSLLLHLKHGHNMDVDEDSPLPPDRSDWGNWTKNRDQVSRHHVSEPEKARAVHAEGEEAVAAHNKAMEDDASKIARRTDDRSPLSVPKEGTRAKPDPWDLREEYVPAIGAVAIIID